MAGPPGCCEGAGMAGPVNEGNEVLRTSCLELPNVPATVSSSHRFQSACACLSFLQHREVWCLFYPRTL